MLKYTADEIIKQIDLHRHNLLLVRSVSPYLKDFMAGRKDSPTAPYYRNRGYKATVWFDEPLTPEKIKAINLATHSVNQGFVIRLYAYLKYCKVYKPNINHNLDGHNEIDILRRLRNCFAHTSGYYNPNKTDQKTLYDRIIRHFNLNKDDFPESDYLFPIPIDTMLAPLVEGCKEYVKALSRTQKISP